MAKLIQWFGYFSDGMTKNVYDVMGQTWTFENGKLFVLQEEPSAELLTWLQANATQYFADEVGK